nr:MAG TPA: hypothetical protein [Caudoviricetes sp.]
MSNNLFNCGKPKPYGKVIRNEALKRANAQRPFRKEVDQQVRSKWEGSYGCLP